MTFFEQKPSRLPDCDARRDDVIKQDNVRFHGITVQNEFWLDAAPVLCQNHILIERDTQFLFRQLANFGCKMESRQMPPSGRGTDAPAVPGKVVTQAAFQVVRQIKSKRPHRVGISLNLFQRSPLLKKKKKRSIKKAGRFPRGYVLLHIT